MTRFLGDKAPIPALDELNHPWFTRGVITIQCCSDCDSVQHPPDEVCESCQGTNLGWRECSGDGRIESVAVVQALRSGILPPTINLESPDDEFDIDLVPNEAKNQQVDYAINNSFGFGGHNVSLIFKRHQGD